MNPVLTSPTPTAFPPFLADLEEILHPDSHEDDMHHENIGESYLHYALTSHVWNALRLLFGGRADVFIAANMSLYYGKGDSSRYYTPDVMIVFGVPNYLRRDYKLGEEGVCPQVIIEVASERTWKTDFTDKMEQYALMGVEEYYVLDSESFLPVPLMAYRREGGRLQFQRLLTDRIFSPRLGLEIILTEQGFRLFDPQSQEFLMTLDEAQSEVVRLRAELAELKSKS